MSTARLLVPALALVAQVATQPSRAPDTRRLGRVTFSERTLGALGTALEGHLTVWENRTAQRGRRIRLHIVVLPATGDAKRPDPIFWLAGGPGGAATRSARRLAGSWMRRDRDIVLVDQRGTGRSNPLRVTLPGSDDDLQGYLEPIFQVATFRAALGPLSDRADLTQYTTPIAADDLNEIRQALGYDKINLIGGSYGTRMALVYMRRHEASVRTAVLNGVAPIAFKNPLFHARAAQLGLDTLLEEVRRDPQLRERFGDLRGKFDTVLQRLSESPAEVRVRHPRTRRPQTVRLSRDAFCEALRILLYYTPTNRQVPALLDAAWRGDYSSFAQRGIASNRALRGSLAFGMLMSVVGSEDIPRIAESEIAAACRGTFLGEARVRAQMAVASIWPRASIPKSYGAPVRVATPTLLLSGTHDPVTPPAWGAEAARHLSRSRHIVVPGAHGVGGPCIDGVIRQLLETGSVADLNTSCIKGVRMPRISSPGRRPTSKRKRRRV